MKLARRKIIYTEMANGKVIVRPNPKDSGHDVNDKLTMEIIPDKGYMFGLIYLKEEITANPVRYEVSQDAPSKNLVIRFNMPNDNVKLSVKFVKCLSII